jgi:hypothetical protein
MCNLIRKSAVLLSILTLLPLANASAELKRVPLILMDTGNFVFTPTSATLKGTGASTHLGQIESLGVFKSLGPGPPGRFKGEIQGEAIAVDVDEMATATIANPTPSPSLTAAPSPSPSPSPTATPVPKNSIKYRLSAEFRPDSGIFYGIGTYVITGGSGKFKYARGFGQFIGLAVLPPEGMSYNCFLMGTISY